MSLTPTGTTQAPPLPVPHLVGVVRHHGLVGHVGHGKDVRRVSRALGANVQLGMLGNKAGREGVKQAGYADGCQKGV